MSSHGAFRTRTRRARAVIVDTGAFMREVQHVGTVTAPGRRKLNRIADIKSSVSQADTASVAEAPGVKLLLHSRLTAKFAASARLDRLRQCVDNCKLLFNSRNRWSAYRSECRNERR